MSKGLSDCDIPEIVPEEFPNISASAKYYINKLLRGAQTAFPVTTPQEKEKFEGEFWTQVNAGSSQSFSGEHRKLPFTNWVYKWNEDACSQEGIRPKTEKHLEDHYKGKILDMLLSLGKPDVDQNVLRYGQRSQHRRNDGHPRACQ